MTKSAQLGLALASTVITVAIAHYARNVDRVIAAPPAAAYGVKGHASGASGAVRRAAEPEVVLPARAAAMPATGAPPQGTPGGSTDVNDDAAVNTPEREPTIIFGIALPEWLDEILGRRRASVPGGMAAAPGDTPAAPNASVATSAATGAQGCKHDPAPHPQGVTAQVDFVGVLLNGQQREGDSFTAAELDDLKILVEWKSLLENHAQRVDLVAPDGSLYQSLTRLVTAGDNGAQLETRVPVNGSWITRYGLYGSWCVEVFLDQESAPLASTRLVIAKPQ
jgi:hypothetical protein